MRPRAFALIAAVSATGCIHKQWVHDANDVTQTEKDLYECRRENSFMGTSVSAGSDGISARRGLEQDEVMVMQCMKARGYRWEKVEELDPDASPLQRWAQHERPPQPTSLEASLALGSKPGRSTVAFAEIERGGDVVIPASSLASGSSGWSGLWPTVGAEVEASPGLSLALTAGVRKLRAREALECDDAGPNVTLWSGGGCGEELDERGGLVPMGTVGVRLVPPFFPRLVGELGVGATTTHRHVSRNVEGDITWVEDQDIRDGTYTVNVPEVPSQVLPYLRYGASIDVIDPQPHGLRVGCAVETLMTTGTSQGGFPFDDLYVPDQRSFGSCSATYRWSPVRESRGHDTLDE